METTLTQTNAPKVSGPTVSKTLMAPPLPRLPSPKIRKEKMDEDDEVTILSKVASETELERHKRKKSKSKTQREKLLSYILEQLEKRQSDSTLPQAAPRIKPPPNLQNHP